MPTPVATSVSWVSCNTLLSPLSAAPSNLTVALFTVSGQSVTSSVNLVAEEVDPLPPANAVRATSPRTTFNGLLKSFVTLHAALTIFPVKLTCPSAARAGKALEKLAATNANIITFFSIMGTSPFDWTNLKISLSRLIRDKANRSSAPFTVNYAWLSLFSNT